MLEVLLHPQGTVHVEGEIEEQQLLREKNGSIYITLTTVHLIRPVLVGELHRRGQFCPRMVVPGSGC